MALGFYKLAIKYLEKYKKNHHDRIEITNKLIEKCKTEIHEKTTVYGFKESSFQSALEILARQTCPEEKDEDVIWGSIVPDILEGLFDEMDRGETNVNIFRNQI